MILIRRAESIEEIEPLVAESQKEGFLFVKRLKDDWNSGTNRFQGEGEGLWVAYWGAEIAACGGLNRFGSQGRLRRLYVRSNFRKTGVGRHLVNHILAFAAGHFQSVVLRTTRAEADAFYIALGFQRVDLPEVTHVKRL